jgi:Ala-tRNA(Pro) deacylase
MFVRASADAYALAVLSAARKLDWKALRGVLGYKKAALADEGEVARVTGCVPGAVPPFGCLWPGVRTLVDESLMAQGDSINFNAGLRTASLRMSVDDYLRVSGGERAAFTADT